MPASARPIVVRLLRYPFGARIVRIKDAIVRSAFAAGQPNNKSMEISAAAISQSFAFHARTDGWLAERDLEIGVMKEIRRKNGERVCSPTASRLRAHARYLTSSDLPAAVSCALGAALSIARLLAKDAPALSYMRRLSAQYP